VGFVARTHRALTHFVLATATDRSRAFSISWCGIS
jgi:hypothetical protein